MTLILCDLCYCWAVVCGGAWELQFHRLQEKMLPGNVEELSLMSRYGGRILGYSGQLPTLGSAWDMVAGVRRACQDFDFIVSGRIVVSCVALRWCSCSFVPERLASRDCEAWVCIRPRGGLHIKDPSETPLEGPTTFI